MTLPPPAVWVVVLFFKRKRDLYYVWARGSSEADCLCKLAMREPDGHLSSKFLGQETYILPAVAE